MAEAEQCGRCESVIPKEPAGAVQVLDLIALGAEQPPSLADLEHPVTAYLNGLAPSSRRPQLAALEAIARRSTRVFSAETMPWQRLRRPHVLKIRSLLEENYLPATANRMLSALRGVLRECWHSERLSMEEYRLAVDVCRTRSALAGVAQAIGSPVASVPFGVPTCGQKPSIMGREEDRNCET
ncbi:MAG: hypothetical protein M3170_00960 [Candidatus Dormibacteraeota bacterium]|nr:hypothetical protein [Candidatus Dormibacteraeota bacterium]